jgi:hypothetical protein
MPIESYFYCRIVGLGRGREIVSAAQHEAIARKLMRHPARSKNIKIRPQIAFVNRKLCFNPVQNYRL